MSLFFPFIKLCLPGIVKMGAVIRISMQMLFKLSSVIPYLNYSFLPHVLLFSSTFQPKHNLDQIGPAASKLTN